MPEKRGAYPKSGARIVGWHSLLASSCWFYALLTSVARMRCFAIAIEQFHREMLNFTRFTKPLHNLICGDSLLTSLGNVREGLKLEQPRKGTREPKRKETNQSGHKPIANWNVGKALWMAQRDIICEEERAHKGSTHSHDPSHVQTSPPGHEACDNRENE